MAKIFFDTPTHSKDYIHRVGRTARAGRAGKAITLVSQYDVEIYLRIENLIGKKLPLYETVEEEVMVLKERVTQALHHAQQEMKELEEKSKFGKKSRTGDDGGDSEQALGVQQKIRGKVGGGGGKKHVQQKKAKRA